MCEAESQAAPVPPHATTAHNRHAHVQPKAVDHISDALISTVIYTKAYLRPSSYEESKNENECE